MKKFEEKFGRKYFAVAKCFVCGKTIYADFHKDRTAGKVGKDDGRLHWNMISHASHVEISCGFGSHWDEHEFATVICDECLDKAMRYRRIMFGRQYPLVPMSCPMLENPGWMTYKDFKKDYDKKVATCKKHRKEYEKKQKLEKAAKTQKTVALFKKIISGA